MGAGELEDRPAPAASWYVLGILIVVLFFSYVDRQVLLLLAEPIRRDLGLSDLQVGLLQGAGVALFTAAASYPLGWLADRFERRLVLAGCIALWSAAVVVCAFSGSFGHLLAGAALVGVGEAGLTPIVYALLPLMFVGRLRQVANSVFAVVAIGSGAIALAATGQLIAAMERLHAAAPPILAGLDVWRLSFLAAAAPAPLMILLVLTLPLRSATAGNSAASPAAATATGDAKVARAGFLAHARRNLGAFVTLYAGVGLGGLAFGAVAIWIAVAAARIYGQSPAEVGAGLGTAQIAAALGGFVLSLAAARFVPARAGVAGLVRGMWAALALAIPGCLALLVAHTAAHAYAAFAAMGVFLTMSTMLYPTVLQSVTPAPFRGRAASMQFIVTMICAAIAPALVGQISDALKHMANGIVVAMCVVAVPSLVGAALLLFVCERRFANAAAEAARSSDAANAFSA